MKRKMRSLCLCLLLMVVGIGGVLAQTSTVRGRVVDATGVPIIGASVVEKGTTHGTVTDVDGNFQLTLTAADATLVIQFIGYEAVEQKAQPQMNVTLSESTTDLAEVVVTGMTSIDKRLFTGAATQLTADDVKLDGVPEISRALEGRAAGVSVQNVSGTFGAAPKIRVRGATSIYGSSNPLWVVDGVIMEDVTEVDADALSSGDAETLISSAIAGLNSDDIESFQILKDGSATSIYGARAMAGVIVVTTKKGRKGTNKISYTGEYSIRLVPTYQTFNIMNSQEQMGVYKEMEEKGWLGFGQTYRAANSGVYGKMYRLMNTYDPATGTYALANTEEARNAYLRKAEMRNTDWFDQLFEPSLMQTHSISMTSGTDKASYYTSMSVMYDPGWSKKSKVNRYTANVNALYKIYDCLQLNMIANAAYRKQEAPGTLAQNVDVVSGEVKRDFDINPYSYALNTSRTLDPDAYYIRNYAPFNIMHELDNNYMDLDVVDTRFQGELRWKICEQLEAAALGAYKYSQTAQKHYIKDSSNQAMAYRAMDDATMADSNPWLYTDPEVSGALPQSVLPYGGFLIRKDFKMNSYDFRGSVTYKDVFAEDHIVNVYAGTEINAVDRNRTSFTGVGLQYSMGEVANYDYTYFKKSVEENDPYFGVEKTQSRTAAFFGTATYSYKGRYTLNGTVRYEGSNKLGKSRSARWLPTWNVSGAWNVHDEAFFAAADPVVSSLTLKASYSLTADRGPKNVTNSRVVITSYTPWRPLASVSESGLQVDDLENSELTYEKKHELNLGLTAGFLRDRLSVAFDVYKRNNYDLIGRVNTPGVGGQITKYANMAEMEASGVEFTLQTHNIVTPSFKWSTDFIISYSKNEITKLDSDSRVVDMITGTGFTMKGYPVRSLFSLRFMGLNDEGLPTFVNESGDVTVSDIYFQERENKDHLVYEGPTEPTTTGSFGNLFQYKGLKLNVFVTYAFGNKIRLDAAFKDRYSDLDAMPRDFKNRFVLRGDEARTDVPVIASRRQYEADSYLSYAYNAYNRSTARVADGGFVRMKEISLSYDFPKSLVKKAGFTDLSVKAQGTNLFLIYADKKLNGQDPEFFNTGGVAAPVPKQITFTLRLGL